MYINGRNAVVEALRAGEGVEKVFIMFGLEGEAINRVRAEAKRAGVPCVTVDRRRFAELERAAGVGARSQGVMASASAVEYADMELLIADLYERGETPLVTALDGITDPHNVGAIIRSAECAGLHGALIGKRDSSGVTDVVMKTSAGAARLLPIARASNIGDVLLGLQQEGLAIVGLDERGTMRYTEYDFTRPVAIVIGSEGDGLSTRVRKMCDTLLSIPMSGSIASLNASVAAGVVFFEARRQRGLQHA
ncbi:MAG TPA: 23S rRNA (guanosine(2251)-2'-O)-methyltransferase RlmB [Candidatus Kapabacteria bacterium]|nr:23S rRNA (guanosine(2251)-2'-O)-methyltransferase RlmB [Candidatus Kapabacteria bacterium]